MTQTTNNVELILVKVLLSNIDIYNKYYKYINKTYYKDIYKELYKILIVLETLVESNKYPASLSDFKASFFLSYPAMKRDEVEAIESIFSKMESIDVSSSVIDDILEAHRERYIASEIANVGWQVTKGEKRLSDVLERFEAIKNEHPSPPKEFTWSTDSLSELHAATYARPGWKWKLQTLRHMMGSLRKGDFGFLFARPEVGKTTFLADMCGHFAVSGAKVLHINNEELHSKIKLRYYQAVLGLTTKELFADLQKNQEDYLARTGGRIYIPDEHIFHKTEIEDRIEAIKPDIIVIDSIDKVLGFTEDRDDLVYKKIYAWGRNLAIQHGPVIGVCHASASGQGKRFLEMDDVAYAKTAKQGEADWILGIGQSFETGKEMLRYLHLCKNKLMGDEDLMEELRHGKLEVIIHPEVAQYEDSIFKRKDD